MTFYVDFFGFLVVMSFFAFFSYKYWGTIYGEITSNIKTRFFSIALGLISTGILFFILNLIVHVAKEYKIEEYLVENAFLSLSLKVGFTTLATALLIVVYKKELEERAKATLDEMNTRYKELGVHSISYFKRIFNLEDTYEQTSILRFVMKNHEDFGNRNEFMVSLDTYLDIVVFFLKKGYTLTSVNSTLIPFWYSPKTQDLSVMNYLDHFKHNGNAKKYKRITYYHDASWMNDTVGRIYDDLCNGEDGIRFAVIWLVTLLANIPYKKDLFKSLVDYKDGVNYFSQPSSDDAIKSIEEMIKKPDILRIFNATVEKSSKDITGAVMHKFEGTMGAEGCHSCTKDQFKSTFGNKITEVGYFENDKSDFALYLLGVLSDSVTLKVVAEKDELSKIKTNIEKLKRING